MKSLTKKQKEIVSFIQEFSKENGYSPTYRDIMAKFQLQSPGSVYNYAKLLRKKGILPQDKYSRMTLLKTEDAPKIIRKDIVELPFIGYLTIGYPIETFSKMQMIAVPHTMVRNNDSTYILQAKNCDLAEEAIADGDLLLVEARQEAHTGEMVVACVHNHDTYIKRFYPEGAYVRLEGSKLQSEPLIFKAEEVIVQGVLVALFRLFEG